MNADNQSDTLSDPRIEFSPSTSSKPGTCLTMAPFIDHGPCPFKGGKYVVDPGSTSRPDTHDVKECWMIAQGTGMLNYDGDDFRISQGDYFYFQPQKTHIVANDGTEPLVVFTVWWP